MARPPKNSDASASEQAEPDASVSEQGEQTEPAEQPDGVLSAAGRPFGMTGPATLRLRSLLSAFAALGHRDYRLLWAGALMSNIGAWMQNVAKSWLVFDLTGSELWLGIDAFAVHAPTILLLPFGGVLADRFDRRRLLALTNSLLALLAVLLAVLHYYDALRVGHIVAVSAMSGICQAMMVPAYQSLLPSMVGRRDLSNAIALNSLQFNLSRVIGPAIGGIVMVKLGATWSFGLNAVSFLAVIAACFVIAPLAAKPRRDESVLDSLRMGVSYLRLRADLIVIITLVVLTGFFGAPVLTMLPALVKSLGGGEQAFSMLLSVFGAGAMIGAIMLAATSRRDPTPWRAFPVLMVMGVCQLFMGTQANYLVLLLLMMLVGMTWVGSMNRLNAAVLGSVPERMRGRVSSFFILAFRGGLPLGGLLAGALAHAFGVQRVFTIFGAAMLVGVVVVLLVARSRAIAYRGPTQRSSGRDAATARSS